MYNQMVLTRQQWPLLILIGAIITTTTSQTTIWPQPNKRAKVEVAFDVSHAGERGLIKQSLCTDGSGFKCWWWGQYTHFITFCQRAQWNVYGTLFLCMSPSMEFLVADVATRSPLMSFVKDNYGLGGVSRVGMKSRLCAERVDIALRPLVLPMPSRWPGALLALSLCSRTWA